MLVELIFRTNEIDKKKKKNVRTILFCATRPLRQRISIVDMKSNLCYPLIDALRIKTCTRSSSIT